MRGEVYGMRLTRLSKRLPTMTCLSTSGLHVALVALVGVGTLSAVPLAAADFRVGNDAQLRNAITNTANGDTITLTSNVTLSSLDSQTKCNTRLRCCHGQKL
jgi:hypothetical protein